MLEPLYQVKASCVYCESQYQTSRVRPSFKKALRTDTDFYMAYKEINPEYYVVGVCPFCGYASSENFSNQLTPAQRQMFEDKIKNNWSLKDYGGERSWEDALQTYKLGLICAQLKNEKDRVIAGLLHHIAWLYREKDDSQQEKRFLEFALDAYVRVYELEGVSVNNARLMYLLGELNRRLGKYNEAVRWFSRVVNDSKIMDAGMIRASREQWAATREDAQAAKMEISEEAEMK
jgi:uncharacterized protein (DUF2225 family)